MSPNMGGRLLAALQHPPTTYGRTGFRLAYRVVQRASDKLTPKERSDRQDKINLSDCCVGQARWYVQAAI